jgi:hypothetical protein
MEARQPLFCSVLFCSVLFCSVLFCSVLFCSVLFCLSASANSLEVLDYALVYNNKTGVKHNRTSQSSQQVEGGENRSGQNINRRMLMLCKMPTPTMEVIMEVPP